MSAITGSRERRLHRLSRLHVSAAVLDSTLCPSLLQAIRSGVIRADDSYSFSLPPGFSEQPVANIQSGNFCMPKCGEPWTEVIFAGSEGKVMVSQRVMI